MHLHVRMPGAMTNDPRYSVTLREDGSPWPITFHFLRLTDLETGEITTTNVGFEIGEQFLRAPGVASGPDTDPTAIDHHAVQWVAKNYLQYLKIAEQSLALQIDGTGALAGALRGRHRKRARLTDDFLRMVAADYRALAGTGEPANKKIAELYNVTPGGASKWIARARERGLLED